MVRPYGHHFWPSGSGYCLFGLPVSALQSCLIVIPYILEFGLLFPVTIDNSKYLNVRLI